jgi:hypothetical protein
MQHQKIAEPTQCHSLADVIVTYGGPSNQVIMACPFGHYKELGLFCMYVYVCMSAHVCFQKGRKHGAAKQCFKNL